MTYNRSRQSGVAVDLSTGRRADGRHL